MRKLFLFLSLFLSMVVFSQPGGIMHKSGTRPKLINNDSTVAALKHMDDSVANARQNEEQKKWSERTPSEEEQNSSGINYILNLQKEQRAREKRAAMIRIGIGLALLIVLIIGLRRRARKKIPSGSP